MAIHNPDTAFISNLRAYKDFEKEGWDLKTIKEAFNKKLVNLAMKNAKETTREASAHGFHRPKRPAALDKQERM